MNIGDITEGSLVPTSAFDQLTIPTLSARYVGITVGGRSVVSGTFYPTGGLVTLYDLSDAINGEIETTLTGTVVVTDAEARRDNQDHTIAEYVVSFRPVTDAPSAVSPLLERIFDSTFDMTFE